MLACTVPCPNVVHWYTRGSLYPLQMSWPGPRVHKMVLSNCTSINGTYSEVLEIFTEAQSNFSELQCASVPVCTDTDLHCRPQTCYSEFVQLTGKLHIRTIFIVYRTRHYFWLLMFALLSVQCEPVDVAIWSLNSGSYELLKSIAVNTEQASQLIVVTVTVFWCVYISYMHRKTVVYTTPVCIYVNNMQHCISR